MVLRFLLLYLKNHLLKQLAITFCNTAAGIYFRLLFLSVAAALAAKLGLDLDNMLGLIITPSLGIRKNNEPIVKSQSW